MLVQARRHETACVERGDAMRALFDADARTRVDHAFAGTGSPIAASAYAHTSNVLAREAELLAVRATAACRADEPAEVASARLACLDDRSRRLANLIAAFANADAAIVQHAPTMAWGIHEPSACDDARALLATSRPSALGSPDLVAQLDRAHVLADAARFREAAIAAESVATAARARNERELELKARITAGEARSELGDEPSQAKGLEQALALAEALGRDNDAVGLLASLAQLADTVHHDGASAHRWIDLARAKLERLGGDNTLAQGSLLTVEAQVLFDDNRLGEAEAALRRAVPLIEQSSGADHPRLGGVLGTLAEVLLAESKDEEALAHSRRSLAILGPALGDDHPTVAGAQMTVAQVLLALRRFDEARDLLERADQVFARVYGPDHATRASIDGNLGALEEEQGHWVAADAAYRRAVAILERTDGPRSVGAAHARRDVARVLVLEGRTPDGLAEQQRAIEILEALGADGEPHLVGAYTELANFQLGAGAPRRALAAAQRAVAVAVTRPVDANPEELAQARLAVGKATSALRGGH
jgi:tetratricopeptide (TPR) repeat protein